MIGIYKITNKINNKSYIGQSIHCGKRLDEHCCGNQFIDEVIQLEGIENFNFEILKQVEKHELNLWEDYYIDKFNTLFPKGYNKKWNCPENKRETFISKIKQMLSKTISKEEDLFSRSLITQNYEEENKAPLTAKQYLVYSYLLSISKWNPQDKEDHYYVYFNSFKIKDACELLKISQPTWRSAIEKLENLGYIRKYPEQKFFLIDYARESYAPLNIQLIKYLVSLGTAMNNGGNIVAVYSVIYKYWKYQKENGRPCEITINQLKKLFISKRSEEITNTYRLMIAAFSSSKLIDCEIVVREDRGHPYMAYQITNVRLDLPTELLISDYGPDDITDILEALKADIETLDW